MDKTMKIIYSSSSHNEQVINIENEINQENINKNSDSKKDHCSELFHGRTLIERTFTGTYIYDKSKEMDNSGK